MTLGRMLLSRNYYDEAIKIFKFSIEILPSKLNSSLYYILWTNTLKKDYTSSITLINKYKLLENFTKLNSKLQYWISYIIRQNGKNELSRFLMEKIVKKNPLSFYGIIAMRELYKTPNYKEVKSIIKESFQHDTEKFIGKRPLSKKLTRSFKRLHLWVDLNNNRFIEEEKNIILNIQNDYSSLTRILQLFRFKKNYLELFKVANNSLDKGELQINKFLLESLFPFDYLPIIKKYSGALDPVIILSLIRQESAFNKKARSYAGARGLMQLMPQTARQLKKNVNTSKLYNPHINIKLGTKYFTNLLKKYDGNLILSLSAYNAGYSKVNQWIKEFFDHDDPLFTIESIPYKETRNYVKYIYRNIFYYKLLKNELVLNKPMEESFIVDI
jgi:soluble lytic murein transglycosylase